MNCEVRWSGGQRWPARAAAGALALSLGACGSVANLVPDMGDFRLPDRATFIPTRSSFNYTISPNSAVAPEDLINAQGQCAAPANPAASQTSSHGVSLDMTECDVVRILGQPQAFDIPAQGDQRHVVLTYRSGERPGIYEFTAGRLTSIERDPGAPPAVAKKPPPLRKSQPPA
ncbi:MAG: hypothetical protein J2P53_10970 [Bradyrhizobiaceae bacterium]|nr:hypothetical protein [Bradyrhizobiaceae bacterium]